ncbi:MAG: TVP38/TMEM64 family protein [Planctomycetota bacterium]|nr:MAG: TVP38/TMEM64 family protein [Planctomycetota bacterium]
MRREAPEPGNRHRGRGSARIVVKAASGFGAVFGRACGNDTHACGCEARDGMNRNGGHEVGGARGPAAGAVETAGCGADRSASDSAAVHRRMRWLLLAVLVVLIVAARVGLGEHLTLSGLARHERQFRAFQAAHPYLVHAVLFVAYVGVTALSLPGATAMTLLTAWLLGFWRAVVLVSFASTTGATAAFLLSRYLFRDGIERRLGPRLRAFDEAVRRNGAWFLFTLRLIPAVPFFVINAAMGLTSMRPWTFWWVSQLGMLPGTMVYVYAGSQFPTLSELATRGVRGALTPRVWMAFGLLAVFPLLVRLAARWLSPVTEASGAEETVVPVTPSDSATAEPSSSADTGPLPS